MAFLQDAPQLPHPFGSDSVLRKPALTTWDAWGLQFDAGTLCDIRLRAAECVPEDIVEKRQHRSISGARKPHTHRRLVSG